VHLGHRKVISKLTSFARKNNLTSLVMTFDPHPQTILEGKKTCLINTPAQRFELIENLGVDVCYVIKFDEDFASINPEAFIKDLLIDKLNMKLLAVSKNYRFGRENQGNIDLIRKLSRSLPFALEVVEEVKIDSVTIKSTLIRETLKQGNLQSANMMLGRNYFLEGHVVKGKRIGSKIGYPTINLEVKQDIILQAGVYISNINYQKKTYNSVVNVGFRPTVDKEAETKIVEAHILNFKDDLYDKDVRINFLEKIRNEKKFGDLKQLKNAIAEDIVTAHKYFDKLQKI
jgi:riboflavin kinase/FMN adenylyltransferase